MQDKTRPLALIVEDEALLALAVEDLLTEEGFDTLCATSEEQVLALTRLRDHSRWPWSTYAWVETWQASASSEPCACRSQTCRWWSSLASDTMHQRRICAAWAGPRCGFPSRLAMTRLPLPCGTSSNRLARAGGLLVVAA
jgi:CheY-like chemotaxis protein